MTYEICSIGPDDLAALGRVVHAAFGEPASAEELAVEELTIEYDRMLGVAESGCLVAGAGAYSFDLTLPGGTAVAVAGVTWVGVLPTHRREGLLRRMMSHQLDDVVARGEPLAVLTASEAVIYGRFGYGVCSHAATAEIATRDGAFRAAPEAKGRCRLVWDDEVAAVVPPIYDAWRRARPGALSRGENRWKAWLTDLEQMRHGMGGPAYHAVHESQDGRPDGYARYRIKNPDSTNKDDGNVVNVLEVIATDAEVEAALWRYLLDLDLAATVVGLRQPLDDPLRWRLVDSRAYGVKAVGDWLWARVLDAPAALGARRYTAAGSLVLDVVDPFRPSGGAAGRFRIDSDGGGAECTPTESEPDLVVAVDALGSAYLGAVPFTTLAAAGRAKGSDQALRQADALFASTPLPFCNTGF